MFQELTEDDPDETLQICKPVMNLLNTNSLITKNNLFSDDSTFILNGEVNQQNRKITLEKFSIERPERATNVWKWIDGNEY